MFKGVNIYYILNYYLMFSKLCCCKIHKNNNKKNKIKKANAIDYNQTNKNYVTNLNPTSINNNEEIAMD